MNSTLTTFSNPNPEILKGSKVVIISAHEDQNAAQDFVLNFTRYRAEAKLFNDIVPGKNWELQSLQNIIDADIVIFFMSSNLPKTINEFGLIGNTSVFNGKYIYNVVHRPTSDYNLIFSDFLKVDYVDLGSAKTEEEAQRIFPNLINNLSEKGFVPGRHEKELLANMKTTGATRSVVVTDVKETIQQPKRMKFKKPIETFADKVLENFTTIMPTTTIVELDISNNEFDEFSKYFNSIIGIKLGIKGDTIFVEELEDGLFYADENYGQFFNQFFDDNDILSLRKKYITNLTGIFAGIEYALKEGIAKEIDYPTLLFLNTYLQSHGFALFFKDGVELKVGEKREGVLKVTSVEKDPSNMLPDFYESFLKSYLPEIYSAVMKLTYKIILYKQDVVIDDQALHVTSLEAPKQSLYLEYFKDLLDPIINILLSPNIHGSDETELKYSDFKLLDSDYVLFEEYIGKKTSCNIKVSMSGYGDSKKIKIKLIKFSLGFMTSGQGQAMMNKLGIIRNSLLQIPYNALKNFATEEDKLCNLSQPYFALLQEFLSYQGIEMRKKDTGGVRYNYSIVFSEYKPVDVDDSIYFYNIYNNLNNLHNRNIPGIFDSWRQSITENIQLQRSIESTTSLFSDLVIKELDRETEGKVTVICVDAEMITDLGFVYLLKEINKRCEMGERIFLVQTDDMNLDFMKGYPKIPKLNLHNSTPFEISNKIRSGGIPESSGNLSMIYMNDLGGKINGSTSDALWKQLRSLKNIKRYAVSLKQFKENQLELISN